MAERTRKNKLLSNALKFVAKTTPAGGLIENTYGAISDIKYGRNRDKESNKLKKKFLDRLMKGYQWKNSETNRKAAKEMIDAGKYKEAKKFIEDKKKEWQKLNYDKHGNVKLDYSKYGN